MHHDINTLKKITTHTSRHTVKTVTCVAPNGALVCSSNVYLGSVSDVAIVEHFRFLEHFKSGDLVLADKGSMLYDKLPTGVSVNIPFFLAGQRHFTKQGS